MVRKATARYARLVLEGLVNLERDFGPLFTGALALLAVIVVLAFVTGYSWLIALAAVLAIGMSIWVTRAGLHP